LSAGCIYGHFRDKEELIEAISARRHSRDAELLSSPGGGLNPLESLRAIASALLDDMQSPPGIRARRIAVELWAEALRNDSIRKQVTGGLNVPVERIEHLIRRAQRASLVEKKIDARALARTIVALFQGSVLQRVWGEPFDSRAMIKIFDALICGLMPRPQRRRLLSNWTD
jgi:AcrR family transcriptional regulator